MHRITQFLIFAALMGGPTANVAAAEIAGQVTDSENGNPIWGANVRVVELDTVVESSRQGLFEFKNIPAGAYHLIISHVAYDRSDTLRVQTGDPPQTEYRMTPKPWVLDDVVVTGTRSPHLLKNVPVQTEVVSQRDFQRTGATTVDEALESSIGVTINDDLAGTTATIRGIQGDRTLVLVDGERAVGRVNGSIDLGQFALSNVDKIEIVKGTGSTLYGSDAMGGVINIITNKGHQHTRNLSVRSEYGAYGTFMPEVSAEFSNTVWGANLGLKYYHTDGFDLDKSTPHTNGQDNIDRWNVDGKYHRQLSDKWRLTGSTRLMFERRAWIESEVWGKLLFVYDDDESNNRYDGSVSLNYLSGDKYQMNFRLYGTYYDHQWNKYEAGTGNWLDTALTDDVFYEASYTSNYVMAHNHVITYGFDYNYQDLRSSELSSEKEADQAGDAYLQYEYSPYQSLTFLPGVRYEHHSSFGDKVNPSLNLMYSPSDGLKLRGFVGQGFRAPSIKQQYYTFDHVAAGYVVFGGRIDPPDNLVDDGVVFNELKDENSINSSISAEFSYGSIGMHRITYFYNHLDDLIEFMYIGSSSTYWRGVYSYQNVERAYTQGIEWESRVRLSSNIDFSFSYDYLKAVDLTTGQLLINRPSHTLKFYLTAFSEKWGLGGSFWGTYQSNKRWVPRSNTGGNEGETSIYFAPHRTTLNLNLFKKLGDGIEAYARVENLLDQVDPFYGYWPGISVYTGVKYDVGFHH